MMRSDGRKLFQIGLAVLIQYRRVTDSQRARHVAVVSIPRLLRRAGNDDTVKAQECYLLDNILMTVCQPPAIRRLSAD